MIYILGTGLVFTLLMYGYSSIIDHRGHGRTRSRKGELAQNMWAATSMDCDFEPTKHAFGPGRSVNVIIEKNTNHH